MIKKLIFALLLLFSPLANSTVIMVTTCDQPVLFIFDYDGEVYIKSVLDLKKEPETVIKLEASLNDGAAVFETSSFAAVQCPRSA